MADSATGNAAAPKPSSSVKLVLLGEAAVGKVRPVQHCHPLQSYHIGLLRQHVVMDAVLQARIFILNATPHLSPWLSQSIIHGFSC
jgi:hypothetical protein